MTYTKVMCKLVIVALFLNGLSLPNVNGQSDFPDGFVFGSATAAYQVEGGWDADGKGMSIWDTLTEKSPSLIFDGSNGKTAADSYNKYTEDVQLLADAKMDFYRFSISWPRVLPTGDISSKNEAGLQYYDNLIAELEAKGIEPMITMYHWDMPQRLQDIGGMVNPLIVDYFYEYAKLLFDRYASRVKVWSTFNEPFIICENGYGNPDRAPLVRAPGVGNYLCAHNLLIAHAKVYRLYKQSYQQTYPAKIGINLNCGFNFPFDETSEADVQAAERAMQFYCGWYAHPLFLGDYPQVMKDIINQNSQDEGRTRSRLPEMTPELIAEIKDTTDYIGLNYYTSSITKDRQPLGPATNPPSFDGDRRVDLSHDETWEVAYSSWLRSVPEGLTGILRWLSERYDYPEIIITENGWSDDGTSLNDLPRIKYYDAHLKALLTAVNDYNCRVTGFTAWSLIDNFEWMRGYSEHFGIYHVDFQSDDKQRSRKDSVTYLTELCETRMLPDIQSFIK